jgi:hypothetical protein
MITPPHQRRLLIVDIDCMKQAAFYCNNRQLEKTHTAFYFSYSSHMDAACCYYTCTLLNQRRNYFLSHEMIIRRNYPSELQTVAFCYLSSMNLRDQLACVYFCVCMRACAYIYGPLMALKNFTKFSRGLL